MRRLIRFLVPFFAIFMLSMGVAHADPQTIGSGWSHTSTYNDCELVQSAQTDGTVGYGSSGANFSSWTYLYGPNNCSNPYAQAAPGTLVMHEEIMQISNRSDYTWNPNSHKVCKVMPNVTNTSWYAHSISQGYVNPYQYDGWFTYVGDTGQCAMIPAVGADYAILTFTTYYNPSPQVGYSWSPIHHING